MFRLETEGDVERLRQAAQLLQHENRRLIAKNLELTKQVLTLKGLDDTSLQLKIAELEQSLAQAKQALYGRSSEKRESQKQPATPRAAQVGHGPRPQGQLPIEEEVHHLDEADRMCPSCGGQLSEWAGQFEEAEEVDVLERCFVLKRHKRQKYRCGCGGCVETALGPPKLIPGGRYSVDFAVEVAVLKYLDHLPLERQVRAVLRDGLVVDSQTLWDQIDALAHALSPTHDALRAYLVSQTHLGIDETRWPLLGQAGATKWHAWALVCAHAVCYRIEEGRSAAAGARVLKDFSGVAMSDGLAVYDALAKGGRFAIAHCWAHVRRKFVECEEFFPQASEAVSRIGQLYAIEAECERGPPGEETRRRLRDTKSRAIVDELYTWANRIAALPQSALGKAIAYMRELRPGLSRFLEDPRIPIDNNATERALRGVTIARTHHSVSRPQRGTGLAAPTSLLP